jgi:hypothetical protein
VVASGSVIVEDITEHEHAPGHTDGDGVLGRYRGQPRRRDKGINFFDVSPFYGITQAEERLGEALAGKRRR